MNSKELLDKALKFYVAASGEGITLDGDCPEETLVEFFHEHDMPASWGDYGDAFQYAVWALLRMDLEP